MLVAVCRVCCSVCSLFLIMNVCYYDFLAIGMHMDPQRLHCLHGRRKKRLQKSAPLQAKQQQSPLTLPLSTATLLLQVIDAIA